jgi:hypothetical protein
MTKSRHRRDDIGVLLLPFLNKPVGFLSTIAVVPSSNEFECYDVYSVGGEVDAST